MSTEQNQAAASFSLVRTVPFNFKKVKEADLLDSLEDHQKSSSDFMSQFEVITEGSGDNLTKYYKRKSFTEKLTLPAFVAELPEDIRETVANILERELQQFVKSQYVDNYQPIGAHDLKTYQAVLSSRSSRSVSWDYTQEQFQLAIDSLRKFIASATGNSEVGERFANAAAQKFTRSAIQRNLGNFEENLLKKVVARLTNWAEYVAEHEATTADEVTVIFDMWMTTLDKHLKADVLDIASYL